MRKFLFVFASTAILAMIVPAVAQYVYVLPPYYGLPVITPPYWAPGYGYMWREQRLYDERPPPPLPQDRQLREYYAKLRTLNIGSASVGVKDPTENYVGECAIGFSEETCRRRGQKYNPPRQN
jgi:hypothetical protein